MKETGLWRRLRLAMAMFDYVDFIRVENLVEDGTPDVNYSIRGKDGWIELKQIDNFPVRKTTRVFGPKGMRESQINFVIRRRECGCDANIFIFAQVHDCLFLLHSKHAEAFNEMTRDDLHAHSIWMHKGRSPDWHAFISSLVGVY